MENSSSEQRSPIEETAEPAKFVKEVNDFTEKIMSNEEQSGLKIEEPLVGNIESIKSNEISNNCDQEEESRVSPDARSARANLGSSRSSSIPSSPQTSNHASRPDSPDESSNSNEDLALDGSSGQQSQLTQELYKEKNIENSALGRNRRVRQKNRYFADFHCIDLTKGVRSNKDETAYDAYVSATSTRTSRRSTTDSNRQDNHSADVFQSKYCRKCTKRTPHDNDSGCQACVYKKIVQSNKRSKTTTRRNRAKIIKQVNNVTPDNDILMKQELLSTASQRNTVNKRRGSKQANPSFKNNTINNSGEVNKFYTHNLVSHLDSDNHNQYVDDNNDINASRNATNLSENHNLHSKCHSNTGSENNYPLENDFDVKSSTTKTNASVTSDEQSIKDHAIVNNKNEVSRLLSTTVDSWTPDEVADYIMSKGFEDEAELFRAQCVDGVSLVLMQRSDFTYGLKIKLGPALKIYNQVCKLKQEYFRAKATTSN